MITPKTIVRILIIIKTLIISIIIQMLTEINVNIMIIIITKY